MEDDQSNITYKKRKTSESCYTKSFQGNKSTYRNNENNYNKKQFVNINNDEKTYYNNSGLINNNCKKILYENKMLDTNYNRNNFNSYNKLTHPFLNEKGKNVDYSDSEFHIMKDIDLDIPNKIYIHDNLKDIYNDDMNKIKQRKDPHMNKSGLSANEYRTYKITSPDNISYENAEKLNKLWNIYINELIQLSNNNELSLDAINDLELNGAYIEVHKSRCSTYVGQRGIIILETHNSFKIVTPKNKVLILLKSKTVFILTIKERQYYLHGIQLLRDPALKSSKKYKILQNRKI
ncbi:ribonuclease P protein subunit p29, putative [Plasmodium sp. DRC-Itaito]|nr:ribonuclease P protein subunit p29, putative [Plasmodium sp. DRC-Itaito]